MELLRDSTLPKISPRERCLNPCCNGITERLFFIIINPLINSLNPCCNGITERLIPAKLQGSVETVLILVVMELLRD